MTESITVYSIIGLNFSFKNAYNFLTSTDLQYVPLLGSQITPIKKKMSKRLLLGQRQIKPVFLNYTASELFMNTNYHFNHISFPLTFMTQIYFNPDKPD